MSVFITVLFTIVRSGNHISVQQQMRKYRACEILDNGILLSYKKNQNLVVCCNLDGMRIFSEMSPWEGEECQKISRIHGI